MKRAPNATSPPRAGRGGGDAEIDGKRQEHFAYTIPKQRDKMRARAVLPFLDLPRCALRVAYVLIDRCNPQTGQCDPTGHRIAHDSRQCESAMWKGVAVLEREGLVRRSGDGCRRGSMWARNAYQINWQKFNALFADLDRHLNAYRRQDGIYERGHFASTSVDTAASTSVDTNLKRSTLKQNLKNGSAVGGAFGMDDDPPIFDDEFDDED